MKKIYNFLGLILILLVIFACTIPSAVEIKWNPSLKFGASMDFNDMFSGMMKDSFNSDNVLNCINAPNYKTFLIYMKIMDDLRFEINGDFDNGISIGDINLPIDLTDIGGDYVLDDDLEVASSDEPISLSLANFKKSIEGFSFDEGYLIPKIFIDGDEIIDDITIHLFLGEEAKDSHTPTIISDSSDRIPAQSSGIVTSSKEYTGLTLPAGGKIIPEFKTLLNSQEDLDIYYEIFLESGTIINPIWLTHEHNIMVELVIWLPLAFIVDKDPGAEFIFPGNDFDSLGKFIKDITAQGMIESLLLEIEMPNNPFKDGVLYIKNNDPVYKIETKLPEDRLIFNFSKQDMDFINNNDFDPEFSIYFEKGKSFVIPIDLRTGNMTLEVDFNMAFDLR